MRIVLDTNCLLVSVQEYSEYHWLWQSFCDRRFTLCYSDDILNEYQEILSRYYSAAMGQHVIDAILNAPHAVPISVYFKWWLITVDPDDNKFVDCAFSGNANYIVTNDRHFNVVKKVDFPKVNVVDIDTFKRIMFT